LVSLTCQVEYPSLSQHVHVENREKKNFFHAHSLLTLIIFELSGVYCKLFLEDPAKTKLMEFGQFVSDSMPKYVQTVQVTEPGRSNTNIDFSPRPHKCAI